jgi:predicted amidohydrolase YtcJ
MAAVTANLILKNAEVITCDPKNPLAEAVAVKGDRIVAVGRTAELEALACKETRVIDCQGRTVVPGFIDAHCHVGSLVNRLLSLDLGPSNVRSMQELKEFVRTRAKNTPLGRWIRGEGYNEFYLAEKRHPTRFDLDQAAPDHPTILIHRSRHACVLNSLGLKIAGIDNFSEEPAGGVIERDLTTGEPNGILFEMLDYVLKRISSLNSESEPDRGIMEANRQFISNGITSLGDATVTNDLERWENFKKFKLADKLQSRIYMMAGMGALEEFRKAGLTTGYGDNHLKVGSLKIVLSEATGRLQPSQDELNRIVLKADKTGFQVAIHAVERSTVEAAVVALEFCQRERPKRKGNNSQAKRKIPLNPPFLKGETRHRIEHCSECPPELRKRLSRLGAVIVSQPSFIYYSGERYLAQVSEGAQRWLYPFKSLLESGLVVAASSDSPVVPGNPLVGIYAAVTRRAESGQTVLPSEAISAKQALEMYTINAAYASHEEDLKGSISPGKLADVVMLSGNPFTGRDACATENIKAICVEMTIIGGKVVWQAENTKF